MASDISAPQPAKGGKAKRVLAIVALLVLVLAGWQGWRWYSHGRFHQETDDAYLQADLIMLQARDTGYVAEVLVAPNAPVKKDQVIAVIDPQDYALALEKAQNALALAESAQVQLDAQIVAGQAAIEQARAALAAAEATNDGAQKSFRRAQELKVTSAGTQAALDAAEATAKSASAQVASARAALSQAKAEVQVLEAKRDSAALDVRSAQTGLRLAQRDLDFTRVRAPFDGILTERQIEVGSFVTTGSRIGTLVPTGAVYVEANFKETQIGRMRPGQKAELLFDSYPDTPIEGRIDSLFAASGAQFSLLPPDNATGNFTKVVQRIPVKLTFAADNPLRGLIRPGMSVEVTVDLRSDESHGG